MGISLWRSVLFFVIIAGFGIMLFPSQREMGQIFMSSGTYSKAALYLEKRFHKNPGDIANTVRYMESLMYEGRDSSFKKVGAETLKLYPASLPVLKIMARFYENRMDFDKAFGYWREICAANPAAKETRDKIITFCRGRKKYDVLINFYEEEIKRGGTEIYSYYKLARLYALRRDAVNALAVYEKILEIFPYETGAKLRIAEISEYAGDGDRAISIYAELSKENPDDMVFALKFVSGLMRHKKNEEALKALKGFLERFKGQETFRELLTGLYIDLKMTDEAITLLKERFRDNPRDYNLLGTIGKLYYDTKDTEKAFEFLKGYHEKTGGDHASHHILGDILSDMGDKSGSRREYEKALELLRK